VLIQGSDPGPFVQYLGIEGPLGRFLGFWATFTNAIYAYSGIENVALAAAETQNARIAIPKAAKKTFWRILIFYVLTTFLIGMIVPSDNTHLLSESGTAASPFVVAARVAGIKGVPHVINAIVVTSAWSAGNAGFMTYVRYLFGLAKSGHAPNIFLRLNRFGIPYVAVLLFSAFMALGYMTTSTGAAEVFTWLQDLLSIAILVNWIVILITYLRFYYGCKRQGVSRNRLPYKSPFQPYFAWICLGFFVLILVTSGWSAFLNNRWSTRVFVSAYANALAVVVLYIIHKFVKKTKLIRLDEMPIRQLVEIAENEEASVTRRKNGWRKLNFLW
jgi:amino acid transporter